MEMWSQKHPILEFDNTWEEHRDPQSKQSSKIFIECQTSVSIRDVPILLAKLLEKYVGKSKEQNAGKIGGKWEKWAPRNDKLAHFVL